MGIIADKLNDKISYSNLEKYNDTIGMIMSYDHFRNVASIVFNNPNGGGVLTADNVPLKMPKGGAVPSAPQNRQKCIISFFGSNLLSPVITDLYNDEYYETVYSKKTSADEGAFIIDQYINTIKAPSKIVPMINDWVETSNTDPEKYTSNMFDYTNVDVTELMMYELAQVDKYKNTEDGITNTKTNATIKCKDNGDIDIFVSNNTGIRINPDNKTINFFSKSMVCNMQEWIINTKNVVVNGNLIVKGKIKTEEVD